MSLPTELLWLTATATVTAFLFIPTLIERMVTLGPKQALLTAHDGNAEWAARIQAAKSGAGTGLAVLAALVLTADAVGAASPLIGAHAQGYFWAHLGTAGATLFGVRPARCLFTVAAAGAQLAIAWMVLMGAPGLAIAS